MAVLSEVKNKIEGKARGLLSGRPNKKERDHPMESLLSQGYAATIPKVGELVEGTVLNVSKSEVALDIAGLTTGIIRGKEIYDESGEYSKIKVGDKVSATVLELENEQGLMELSFRYAGHQKAWGNLENLMKNEELVEAKIIDANKGGLMGKIGNVIGFLPVSQLNTEHYPRVEGGDKSKILIALKKFIGQSLKVKIIDLHENEEKLIVSEKSAWEEKQQKAIQGFKVGDVVSGKVTAVVDFGAFVEFGSNLEGLVHISELAWQRIENPKEIIKTGDKIKAEIISIEGSRISLSMKKLIEDPWKNVAKRYKVDQKVTGKVLKINPFGAFVELDKDIHGLAHVSEMGGKTSQPEDMMEEGKTYDFTIISLEPQEHRLGLAMIKKSINPEINKSINPINTAQDNQESKEKEKTEEKTEIKEEKEAETKTEEKEKTEKKPSSAPASATSSAKATDVKKATADKKATGSKEETKKK